MKISVLYNEHRPTRNHKLTTLSDLATGETFVLRSAYYQRRYQGAPALYMVVAGGYSPDGFRTIINLKTGRQTQYTDDAPIIRYKVRGNQASEA